MSEQDQRDHVAPAVPLPQDPLPAPDASSAPDSALQPEDTLETPRPRKRHINLDGILWAAILIWSGLVLLSDALGYLAALGIRGFEPPWELPIRPAVWTLIFLGAALLIGLDIVVHLTVPIYHRNVLGYVILTIVCLSLGLGRLGLMWPLILVAVGVALLLRRYR